MKKNWFKYGLRGLAIVSLVYPQIALANTSKLMTPITQLNGLETPCQLSQKKPLHLAQRNGSTGCWKLIYSVAGIVYESIIVLQGSGGKMLTAYYDSNVGRTAYVEQTMKIENSARGILILGYNPVYPDTNRRHPTYSADNFLLQVRPSGETIFATCDDAGRCSWVDVEDCPL